MRVISIIFAIVGGVIVLLGYFVPALLPFQSLLLNWAIILAGAASIIGVFNLVLVHANKISSREKGNGYSALLLACLLATFIFGLVLGPDHPDVRLLINSVVVPVESTLMALLAVTLLYACVRLLRRRTSPMVVVFVATVTLLLLASATLPFGQIGALNDFLRPWILHVLAAGAARGILIGIALGTLVTGLRVLIGADRPYEAR